MITEKKTRLDYRFEKAANLVAIIKGDAAFASEVQAILDKVKRCRSALLLMDADADATPALHRMVQSIERMLHDADGAVLRTFLFTVPKKQARALHELDERIQVLQWIVDELSSAKGGDSI